VTSQGKRVILFGEDFEQQKKIIITKNAHSSSQV
jgi:hypothetical protein